MIITMTDMRRVFCAKGVVALMKSKGWDNSKIQDFIKNGAHVDELSQMGEDALLKRVVDAKQERDDG